MVQGSILLVELNADANSTPEMSLLLTGRTAFLTSGNFVL
jgi:hypothetical protein